jgi:hypothetical protein
MLDYNIVWFEDSTSYINAAKPIVEKYLKDLGYALNVVQRKDDTDFAKIMNESDVDLVLIDQNLRNGKRGDKLIDAIRKNEMYTDAVFYSKDPWPADVIAQLEGVFYTKRETLVDKTKKIVFLTLKKNQDICNIRGQFIAETIDAITALEDIISKILKLENEQLTFYNDSFIQEGYIEDMNKYKIVSEFLRQKLKFLNDEIAKGKNELDDTKKELEGIKAIFKSFHNDIITRRNRLAHSKKSTNKKNTLMVKNTEKHETEEWQLTDDECKKIRLTFAKHANNLEALRKLFDDGKL